MKTYKNKKVTIKDSTWPHIVIDEFKTTAYEYYLENDDVYVRLKPVTVYVLLEVNTSLYNDMINNSISFNNTTMLDLKFHTHEQLDETIEENYSLDKIDKRLLSNSIIKDSIITSLAWESHTARMDVFSHIKQYEWKIINKKIKATGLTAELYKKYKDINEEIIVPHYRIETNDPVEFISYFDFFKKITYQTDIFNFISKMDSKRPVSYAEINNRFCEICVTYSFLKKIYIPKMNFTVIDRYSSTNINTDTLVNLPDYYECDCKVTKVSDKLCPVYVFLKTSSSVVYRSFDIVLLTVNDIIQTFTKQRTNFVNCTLQEIDPLIPINVSERIFKNLQEHFTNLNSDYFYQYFYYDEKKKLIVSKEEGFEFLNQMLLNFSSTNKKDIKENIQIFTDENNRHEYLKNKFPKNKN